MLKDRWTLAAALVAGWLCLWSCCSGAAASEARYSVDVWGADEGLPQGSVIAMVQTRDGYLWLGTLNGLVRFDGIRFTVFDESNTPGLESSRIVSLFEDSQTNLWIGTETAGAALAKDGRVISLDIGRGRREGRLMGICEDSTGAVWLYTADGELARYRSGKTVWNLGPSRCRALAAEKTGLVWAGTDQGLVALNPAGAFSPTVLPVERALSVGRLNFLLASKRSGYWRLADGVIQKYVEDRLECDWGTYPWSDVTVSAACEDQAGNLVVGTLGQGLFWFDAEGKVTNLSTNDGLSNNYILSLHADKEGTLWVGTDGGGLNRVKLKIFKPLEESLGLNVQSVCEDEQGGLWFSSSGIRNGRIDYLKDGVLLHARSGLAQMNLFDMRTVFVDRDQKVWAGTFGVGLFQLQNDLFQPAGAGVIHPEVSAVHQDRAGRLWVGTQGGLGRWDGQAWKVFTTADGLSANMVRAIADDAEGNLWIGTERGGLNRLRDGQFTSLRQTNGFPSDNITSLYADGDGALWAGTSCSGLVRLQSGKWKSYTTDNGLIGNGIDYIIEDSQACLWIGSNRGLMRVKKKDLNDFARGAIDFIPCRTYGKRDGLPSTECSLGAQPAAFRSRNGTLWFPTTKGLASVDPTQFHSNTNPVPVIIEAVLVNGQKLNTSGQSTSSSVRWAGAKPPQEVIVPAGKELLEIQYTSLNLDGPDRGHFRYWMENHETVWTDAHNRRVAPYSKLPPGNYRFHVSACNEDGEWSQTGGSLSIIILPPFWRTWWFLSATAAGLLGIIIAGVYYISTQKLQRQLAGLRQHEALEKERARIARDIHDQVGASLTQVSLLGEMVESDKDFPEEVEQHARQISQTARETSKALDEIVWTVNPSNDTLDGLINYICKHAQEYLAVAGLRYRLEVPAQLPATAISPEARHNVFLAAKESVTNVVKHAKATEVWIRLRLETTSFTLEIEDNGRGPAGLEDKAKQARNGLRNMRKRMEDIGGEFSIVPGPEGGSLVRLKVPITTH